MFLRVPLPKPHLNAGLKPQHQVALRRIVLHKERKSSVRKRLQIQHPLDTLSKDLDSIMRANLAEGEEVLTKMRETSNRI
jgi:hypothetical protein